MILVIAHETLAASVGSLTRARRGPPAQGVWSLSPWTAREVPSLEIISEV